MSKPKQSIGRRFFVALLNEKIGPAPLPTYGEFVQARMHSIEQHLHHVRTVSVNISREGRRRNATATSTAAAPAAALPESNKRNGKQKGGEPKRTRRSRAGSAASAAGSGSGAGSCGIEVDVETDETEDDGPPLLDGICPLPTAPPSTMAAAAASSSAAVGAGRPERTTEKTHLVVCENPLALLDSINGVNDRGRREPGVRLHTYMACVAGPFEQFNSAVRYCKKWGEGSRGSGPRASWGDSLFHIQGVQFFVDPEVIFSAQGPAPPTPDDQSGGSSSAAAAAAAADSASLATDN